MNIDCSWVLNRKRQEILAKTPTGAHHRASASGVTVFRAKQYMFIFHVYIACGANVSMLTINCYRHYMCH